jgi:hypothetical protein
MVRSLSQAQAGQIAALDAARRYLDTGDSSALTGSDGLLKMKTAVNHALQSFQQQQIEYKRANKLISVTEPRAP